MAISLTMNMLQLALLAFLLISLFRSSFAISAGSKALIVDLQDILVSSGPIGLARDMSNLNYRPVLRQERR